jgi:hypothetical protein
VRLALVVAVLGCGRVGFVPQTAKDASTPDVAIDADPATGCADGTREAFVDLAQFPTLAGCAATWNGTLDMRAPPTGARCGDGIGPCAAPADACATGWHVCGVTGDPTELSTRATEQQCAQAAPTGAFALALSHCSNDSPCMYTAPFGCLRSVVCAEAVCCGPSCGSQNACKDGVYPTATHVVPLDEISGACSAMPSTMITGIACCR